VTNPSSVGQAAPAVLSATAGGDAGSAGPAVPPVDVMLPLHLAPVGNRREPYWARARRTRREIAAVLGALDGRSPPPLPVVVLLVRVGWNRLDVDGLVASVKAPIDAIARWLGVDDRDRCLHWHLAQSVTREKRLVRRGGVLRSEAASSLRVVARPWQTSDGDDPLRVLAVAPPASEAP
jgi:hypothetical protein